jgi:hypothetical protein
MQILDDYVIRNKESFRYAHELKKKTGILDHVIEWCKDELVHDWRWQLVEMSSDRQPGRYIFYFDSERDYFAFLLRWQ